MKYYFHRLAGRILRRVVGIQREPVRVLTEADLRRLDNLYGLLVALIAAGSVVAILLTISLRTTC